MPITKEQFSAALKELIADFSERGLDDGEFIAALKSEIVRDATFCCRQSLTTNTTPSAACRR